MGWGRAAVSLGACWRARGQSGRHLSARADASTHLEQPGQCFGLVGVHHSICGLQLVNVNAVRLFVVCCAPAHR